MGGQLGRKDTLLVLSFKRRQRDPLDGTGGDLVAARNVNR